MTSSLQDLLDAFLNGGCPPEEFLSKLSAYCDTTPDSSWEVLALLDQYHRRGKLSGEHFRKFRRKIEFHALGIPDPEPVHKPVEHTRPPEPARVPEAFNPPEPATMPETFNTPEPATIPETFNTPEPVHPYAPHVASPPHAPASPAIAEVAAAATSPDAEELMRLRSALETERERSQRYRHRIATLAEYGRQHRAVNIPRAGVTIPTLPPVVTAPEVFAPEVTAPEVTAPVVTATLDSTPVAVPPAAAAPLLKRPAPFAPQRMMARHGKALIAVWLAQHRQLQRPRAWSSAALLVAAATVISGSSSNLGQVSQGPGTAITPVTFEGAPELPAAILEPRTVSLADEKFIVFPGNSSATIEVERTGDTGGAASFRWRTQSAGAKAGQDYVGKAEVAQFDAGQTSVQLPVRILANPKRTHTEMFYVVIEPGDELALGPNKRAAVFIMRAK